MRSAYLSSVRDSVPPCTVFPFAVAGDRLPCVPFIRGYCRARARLGAFRLSANIRGNRGINRGRRNRDRADGIPVQGTGPGGFN